MFFVHVKGLGFAKFMSVDGGVTQAVFFTHDFECATRCESIDDLNEELNGDIADNEFQIVRIEVI